VTSASLGCARCGVCCEDIAIRVSPERFVEMAEAEQAAPDHPFNDSATFIVAHWDPVKGPGSQGHYGYRCRRYDAEHHLCTAWDDRPQVCRGFPWYDGEPGATDKQLVHKQCSYWLDVPPERRRKDARPLIPLTVL